MKNNNKQSLYEQLGGIYAIAAVVDDFIERVHANPIINANPLVKAAYEHITLPGLKYLVTEQLGAATGGPQHYSGRSMLDSHEHMKITEAEWEAFIGEFSNSMRVFEVPNSVEMELVAIINSTKAEIVL